MQAQSSNAGPLDPLEKKDWTEINGHWVSTIARHRCCHVEVPFRTGVARFKRPWEYRFAGARQTNNYGKVVMRSCATGSGPKRRTRRPIT